MTHHATESALAGLVEAAASVAGQTGLRQVLETTVTTAMELTGARFGALGVLGEHGALVDFIHAGIPSDQADRIGRLPEGRGVLGVITRAGKTIRLDDIARHPDSVGFPDHHPPMQAFLGVPVRVGEHIFGNLYLTEREGGFTEDDEVVVESLAVIAGSAVSTARLHERLRRVALVEDRERIARELHDSVIQEIFAVGLSLQVAASHIDTRPDEVRERILEAVDQLDSSITALRRYIFDIRRTAPADLATRMRELAEQLARPAGVEIRLVVNGDPGRVSPAVSETAIGLAQEAISNAVRHSGAPVVDLTLTVGDTELLVEVRDNGAGFQLDRAARGMGLSNLRTRAAEAGGQVDIASVPGRGTAVRAVLPLT